MIMSEPNRIVLKTLNQTRARLANLKTSKRICRDGPFFLDELRANLRRLFDLLGNAVDDDPIMNKLCTRLERAQARFQRLDALATAEWEALRHDVHEYVLRFRTFQGGPGDGQDRGHERRAG